MRNFVPPALLTTVVVVATLVGSSAPAASGTVASTALTAVTIRTASTSTVFAGGLYVQSDSTAAKAASTLAAAGDTAGAAAATTIAQQPIAIWLGSTLTGATLDKVIAKNLAAAELAGTTPVFVTYAVPNRDCGGYSAGGLSASGYATWSGQIADDLSGHHAVVLVEPDSLSSLTGSCLSEASTRPTVIATAVAVFAAAGVPVYLDGGNENWNSVATQAAFLKEADIAQARGFFTNVSNFYAVDSERAYAERLSAATGGSHYVIDVSRNGRGWLGTWCNPVGAGLGQAPHVTYGTTALDALLWVKTPGVSDGTCNGGPAAGVWWSQGAIALLQNGVL